MSHLPDGLSRHCIDAPGHPDFERIYDLYTRIFKLESQRVAKEDFQTILGRNRQPHRQQSHSKAIWTYFKNSDNTIIAANNSYIFPTNRGPGIHATMHSYYSFIHPDHAGKKLFVPLNKERYRVAREHVRRVSPDVPENLCMPIIAEQNAPLRQTKREFILDTESSSGVTPVARRVIYEDKADFRTLAFRYIQPRLSLSQPPCPFLELIIRAPRTITRVPTYVVTGHLDELFALSFPANTSRHHFDLAKMHRSLEANAHIAILPPGRARALAQHLTLDMVRAVAPEAADIPLYRVFPEIGTRFHHDVPQTHVSKTGMQTHPHVFAQAKRSMDSEPGRA